MKDIRDRIANEIDRLRKAPLAVNHTSEKLDILFKALIELNRVESKILEEHVSKLA